MLLYVLTTQVTATGAYKPTLTVAGALTADVTAYVSVLPGACFEVDPDCTKGAAVTIQVRVCSIQLHYLIHVCHYRGW
jgi:hypothetical protein